jgi:hypothetical protein
VPTMDQELRLVCRSMEELGILGDVQALTSRHWEYPFRARETLHAMLLGPGTPAHSPTDLCLGLDWGKNRMGQTLGRVAPEGWMRLLRRSMRRKLREILTTYHAPHASAAMKSRYRLTFILDITTLLKVGKMLGLGGRFYSGMLQRPAHSIEVVVLYVVVGEGWLCLPLDLRIRTPDVPKHPPHLTGIQLAKAMLEDLRRSLACRFLGLEGHFLVVDAWFDEGHLLRRAKQMGLMPILQGKTSFVFEGAIQGRPFQGAAHDLLDRDDWTWKCSPQCPDLPYVRLTLTNPTFGKVLVVLRKRPGEEKPDYLLGLELTVTAPRMLRAYRRRPWIEAFFEACKAMLHIEQFKFRTLGGISGMLAFRFLSFVVFEYAGRRLSRGRRTGGQILRTLRYHGTLWLKQLLAAKVLSPYSNSQTHAP